LDWIGHVVRLDHRKTVKKIFESKPEGSSRGRPRQRWQDIVEKDQWEMTVKRWRQKAFYKEEQASVIGKPSLSEVVEPRSN